MIAYEKELPADADAAAAQEMRELLALLRAERMRRGLTKPQVGERMGVSQSRVSAIETGPVESVQLVTLVRYVRALGGRLRLDVRFEEDEEGADVTGTQPLNGDDAGTILGIVWRWIANANDGLGFDADDLGFELRQAGYGPVDSRP